MREVGMFLRQLSSCIITEEHEASPASTNFKFYMYTIYIYIFLFFLENIESSLISQSLSSAP